MTDRKAEKDQDRGKGAVEQDQDCMEQNQAEVGSDTGIRILC